MKQDRISCLKKNNSSGFNKMMDRSRLQFSFNAQNSPRSSLKNIPIFFFNTAKQMISSESTVQEVSFKRSPDTISSKNSKVRTCF